MFSYICLGTNDPKRSRVFYDTVLATLGQTRCTTPGEEFGDWSGWGQYAQEGVVQLALWLCPPFDGAPAQPGNGVMVALRALSTDAVDGFHRVATVAVARWEGALDRERMARVLGGVTWNRFSSGASDVDA